MSSGVWTDSPGGNFTNPNVNKAKSGRSPPPRRQPLIRDAAPHTVVGGLRNKAILERERGHLGAADALVTGHCKDP